MKKKKIIVKYNLTKKKRIIFYFINIINFIYIKKNSNIKIDINI